MKKILVCILSRANYGRLKSLLQSITSSLNLKLQLIVGASALSTRIDYNIDEKIYGLVEGDNTEAMVLTTGLLMAQFVNAYKRLQPDMVFIHGDRYEVLAAATAAAYMNIPLCHTEGGECTGTIDDKVRYAISSMADIHFPVTQKAAEKLKNFVKGQIHVVGSTALDTLKNIDLTNNRTEPYIVVLHHPNTTHPEDITSLIGALKEVPYKKVWVNPNVDAGAKEMLKKIHKLDVEFVKDLTPEEYARLIYNSVLLIGNTSSGIKEGAFLGVPYVCVGRRQENREHANNVIFSDYHKGCILNAIKHYLCHERPKPSYKFGDGTAAEKIVKILEGLK